MDIIYISPVPLCKAVTEYYEKILEFSNIENGEERVKILCPSFAYKTSMKLSTSALLNLSFDTIN